MPIRARRFEKTVIERCATLTVVRSVSFAGDLETRPRQRSEFALTAHTSTEGGVVIASAAPLLPATHDVGSLEPIMRG